MNKNIPKKIFIWTMILLLFSLGKVSYSDESETLSSSVECLVCGNRHTNADHIVRYKGRKIPLCSTGCDEHYREAQKNGELDPITAKIEPRAALFQEDSNPKDRLGRLPFWFGYFVLLGLVFGGTTSYLAIQKGGNAWSGFMLGFLLNVLGFMIVFLRPKRETLFHSEGLSKVPLTRQEVLCSGCGHANHPSGKKCNECGDQLQSTIQSEVEAVALGKGD